MRIRNLVWPFLLVIYIVGCTASPGLQATAQYSKTDTSLPPTPARTVVITASPFPVSTKTATPAHTSTITPANTSTPESTASIQQKCLQVHSALPQNKSYDGKIVFIGKHIFPPGKNAFVDSYSEVSFYDLKTRQTVPLQQYKTGFIFTSPDRKKYALLDVSDYLVKIFSSEGHLLSIVPKGADPWFIDRWLDNQHIVLVVAQGFPTMNQNEIKYPRDVVIANPFTNEQKFISSDYLDIDRATGTIWNGGSTTEYDSTLTRVVYPSTSIDRDYNDDHGWGYVLWDTLNNKKLVQIVTNSYYESPKWSPDDSRFLISGANGEMYDVTRDGEVMQMTHLNPDSQNKQSSVRYDMEDYSWSPDGQFVALWLVSTDTNQSHSGTFAILDTISGEIIDYCISAGLIENVIFNRLSEPVWSPDGKYLTIKANIQENGNFDTLLIDLEDGSTTKIGENLSPAGWLVTSQE